MTNVTETLANAPQTARYMLAAGMASLALAGGLRAAEASAETPPTPETQALQDECVTDALYSFQSGTVGYAPKSTKVVTQHVEATALPDKCDNVVTRTIGVQQRFGKKPSRLHPNTDYQIISSDNEAVDVTRKQLSWIPWTCKKYFGQVVVVQAEVADGGIVGKVYQGRLAKPTC